QSPGPSLPPGCPLTGPPGRLVPGVHGPPLLDRPPARVVERDVADNFRQPGGQIRFAIELIELLHRDQGRLLDDVLRVPPVPEHADSDAPERPPASFK